MKKNSPSPRRPQLDRHPSSSSSDPLPVRRSSNVAAKAPRPPPPQPARDGDDASGEHEGEAAVVLRRDALKVLQYLDGATAAFIHHLGSLPAVPPDTFTGDGGGRAGQSAHSAPVPLSLAGLTASPAAATLQRLVGAGNSLLHWFSILELKTPPAGTTIHDAEQQTQLACQEFLTHLAALRAWAEAALGSPKQAAAMVHPVADDCAAAVQTISAQARNIGSVRRVVAERDLDKARQLVRDFLDATTTPTSGTKQAGAARRSAAGGAGGAKKDEAQVARSYSLPLMQWLDRTWIPAMEEWQALVARSRAAARTGDRRAIEQSLERTHAEVVSRSNSIAQILLPGETLAQLVRDQIEVPLRDAQETAARRTEVIANLRRATTDVDFANLASCIRAAEAIASPTAEERQAIAAAQQLLVDVQLVAKTTVALSLGLKAREPLQLVRAVHQANQVMHRFRIFADPARCDAALRLGAQLSACASAADLHEAARAADPLALHVAHIPGGAWAAELSVLYQRACDELAAGWERVRLQAAVVEHLRRAQGHPVAEVHEVRALVERCRQLGLESKEALEMQQLLRSACELRLKVHHDSNIRIVVVDGGAAFEDVVARLAAVCGGGPADALRIRYQDADGDFISVLTADDWAVLLADTTGSAKAVEIYCDFPAAPRPATEPRGARGGGFTSPSKPQAPSGPPPPHAYVPPRAAITPPRKLDDASAPAGASAAAVVKLPTPSKWQPPSVDLELHTVMSVETTEAVRAPPPPQQQQPPRPDADAREQARAAIHMVAQAKKQQQARQRQQQALQGRLGTPQQQLAGSDMIVVGSGAK